MKKEVIALIKHHKASNVNITASECGETGNIIVKLLPDHDKPWFNASSAVRVYRNYEKFEVSDLIFNDEMVASFTVIIRS